jgi:hypothetical protein
VESGRFATVAWELVSQADLTQTLAHLVRSAREITAAGEVGVMRVVEGGAVQIAATSTALVRRADELQLQRGEGPCLQASRQRELAVVHDLRGDPRWPVWGPAAADLGWSSVLSLPLIAAGGGWGALNLYADTAGVFSPDDVEVGQLFARHASIALTQRVKEEHLHAAMHHQHLIGQAQGVLMERFALPPDRALRALQRLATLRQVDIQAVAEHVLGVRRLPDVIPHSGWEASAGAEAGSSTAERRPRRSPALHGAPVGATRVGSRCG